MSAADVDDLDDLEKLDKFDRLDILDYLHSGSSQYDSSDSDNRRRSSKKDSNDATNIRRFYLERRKTNARDKFRDPPILWTTSVIPRNGKIPLLKYQDDKPLKIDLAGHRERKAADGSSTDDDDETTDEEVKLPEWHGCVFEIEVGLESDTSMAALRRRKRRAQTQVRVQEFLSGCTSLYGPNIKTSSPFLCTKLVDIVSYYPSFQKQISNELLDVTRTSSKGVQALNIDEPYCVLLHHFLQISEFVENAAERSQNTDKGNLDTQQQSANNISQLQMDHLQQLLVYLAPIYQSKVLPIQQALEGATPRIAFDMLWYIFKPGTDVYLNISGTVQICVVRDSYVQSQSDVEKKKDRRRKKRNPRLKVPLNETPVWTVELWNLASNGASVGRNRMDHNISYFTGLKDIFDLTVCPVSLFDTCDQGKRRNDVLRRNKFLWKALEQGHSLLSYDGPADDKRHVG